MSVQEVHSAEEVYQRVRTKLKPRFAEFVQLGSTRELEAHPAYQEVREDVRFVLDTPEQGDYTREAALAKDAYRVFAWNIERGVYFDEQLEVLRNHPYASSADLLLLTETDVGMARSGNHAVAQEFAQALGMTKSMPARAMTVSTLAQATTASAPVMVMIVSTPG